MRLESLMNKKYKVMIGYIRADIDTKKVVYFLKRRCSNIEQLEACKKSVGFQGSVSYFLASLDSKKDADNVIRILNGIKWRGHSLVAHVCQERTSANESRSVDWRNKKWGGTERRIKERRTYKRHNMRNEADCSQFYTNTQLDPMYIPYTSEESLQFLSQLIGSKNMQKRGKPQKQ